MSVNSTSTHILNSGSYARRISPDSCQELTRLWWLLRCRSPEGSSEHAFRRVSPSPRPSNGCATISLGDKESSLMVLPPDGIASRPRQLFLPLFLIPVPLGSAHVIPVLPIARIGDGRLKHCPSGSTDRYSDLSSSMGCWFDNSLAIEIFVAVTYYLHSRAPSIVWMGQ